MAEIRLRNDPPVGRGAFRVLLGTGYAPVSGEDARIEGTALFADATRVTFWLANVDERLREG
jgi:hypothetical protein